MPTPPDPADLPAPLPKPLPDQMQTAVPFGSTAIPAAATPARPKLAPADSAATDNENESGARPKNASPWTIAFAVLSVVLAFVVLVFGSRVSNRDRTIQANKNRAEQVEQGATVMMAQLNEANAVTARIQQRLDETSAEVLQLKTSSAQDKVGATELQEQLDKSRLISAGFQTQMAEAKVAALKYQGEVEVAQAQTTVAKTHAAKAVADLSQAQAQLLEAKAAATDLQTRLAKAEQEIAQLKKPPVRK